MGIDFFTIYSSKPYNPNIKKALTYQNTNRSFPNPHSALVKKMDRKSIKI